MVHSGRLLILKKIIFLYYNCKMSKNANVAEIEKGPVEIHE